jgi:hypothetical protein
VVHGKVLGENLIKSSFQFQIMSTLSIIKTKLHLDVYSVAAVHGVTASSFCQSITNVPDEHRNKARVFVCIDAKEFVRLQSLFSDNPVPSTDDSMYDFYALKPSFNRDSRGTQEERADWCGVSILLKMLKDDSLNFDTKRVMLKIQRETSKTGVQTVSIYAYNHEPRERDVLRKVSFFSCPSDAGFRFDRLPFWAVEWQVIKNEEWQSIFLVLDKNEFEIERNEQHSEPENLTTSDNEEANHETEPQPRRSGRGERGERNKSKR